MTRAAAIRGALSTRLRGAVSGRRGSAQLGLVLAAAAVAGGMTLGSGVAAHDAHSGYDLAWLTDSRSGQLVQVDPVLGRTNVRLQVAAAGDGLVIQQGDGQLVVVDRRTGKISSIDLGTLLVGGSRTADPADKVKVLLAGERLYVADLTRGTVQAVDPATQADIGTPYSAGHPIVDIGVDGRHDVWLLDDHTDLENLRWSEPTQTLTRVSSRVVAGAVAGSVIVGHSRGITLVGARGAILRLGTGDDRRLDAPRVRGPLSGPLSSPSGLVPVSDPSTSSVVIVSSSTAVVDDVSSLGCSTPGAPTVFDGKVYVPCTGGDKVIVLDPDGKQNGSAIPTPSGGDPQLTVSGGHLLIDVPGSGTATVVDATGGTRQFPTIDPHVGVQNPSAPPPSPPAPPSPSPHHHPHHGNQPAGGGRGEAGPGGDPSSSASSSPSAPHDTPSAGVPSLPAASGSASAQTRPDGSVLVSWTVSAPGNTVVTDAGTGTAVATVPGGAKSATVTVLAPGTTTSFLVRNAAMSATTNPVTTSTAPGAVTGVTVSSQGIRNSRAQLAVTWAAAPGNGAPVSYSVRQDGGTAATTTSALNATITVPCSSGCSGSISVTPSNSAGTGTAGSGTYTVQGAQPTPPPNTPPAAPPTQPTTPPPPVQTTTPPPALAAMPNAGETLLSSTATPGNDNDGTPAVAHVTVTAPADWAAFPGTCALESDQGEQAIPCNASGLVEDFEYYAQGVHTFTVVARDSGRSVESASKSQSVIYRNLCPNSGSYRQVGGGPLQRPICGAPCPGCAIPFLDPTAGLQPSAVPAEYARLVELIARTVKASL